MDDAGADKGALEVIESGLVGEIGCLEGEFPTGLFAALVAIAGDKIGDGARGDAGRGNAEFDVGEKVGIIGVGGNFGWI